MSVPVPIVEYLNTLQGEATYLRFALMRVLHLPEEEQAKALATVNVRVEVLREEVTRLQECGVRYEMNSEENSERVSTAA